MTSKLKWTTGSMLALFAAYLLCRYAFFGLHGMKSWPLYLWGLGLLALGIGDLFNKRKLLLCAPAGYLLGFALGMLLGRDGLDPGGGTTNNAWLIWLVVYLLVMLAGLLWDWLSKRRQAG